MLSDRYTWREARQYLPLAILWAGALAGCDCGGTGLGRYGALQLDINSPGGGAAFGLTDTIDFKATLNDNAGVKDLTLKIANHVLNNGNPCTATVSPTTIVCESSFAPKDSAPYSTDGTIVLTAVGRGANGDSVTKSVTISIESLKIQITSPGLTQPSIAEVSGSGPLAVVVTSAVMLKAVTVTYDSANPLESWSTAPPPTNTYDYTYGPAMEAWYKLGTGAHTLVGTAEDINGKIATTKLDILVKCQADSDCPSSQRCCLQSGTCNPIVASGADCDCSHPCPLDEGCFPGTCGQGPAACRTGCFPGSRPDASNPFGKAADKCPDQNLNGQMVPAYCLPLPGNQTTPQNQGGACAPGDACDVVKQDCPDLPLHRGAPEGPNNPLVPYTCMPVAPGVNGCFPAGTTPAAQTGCDVACDNDSTNCVKGYVCVSPYDPTTGQQTGPATCQRQCSDPSMGVAPTQAPDCPQGQYCGGLASAEGDVPYTTGSCEPLPGGP